MSATRAALTAALDHADNCEKHIERLQEQAEEMFNLNNELRRRVRNAEKLEAEYLALVTKIQAIRHALKSPQTMNGILREISAIVEPAPEAVDGMNEAPTPEQGNIADFHERKGQPKPRVEEPQTEDGPYLPGHFFANGQPGFATRRKLTPEQSAALRAIRAQLAAEGARAPHPMAGCDQAIPGTAELDNPREDR